MARILIADDDVEYLKAFRTGMTALGHKVTTATYGNQAVELLSTENEEFDIVFLDVVMSDSGVATRLNRIREAAPDIPIVIISGRLEVVDSPLFVSGLRQAQVRLRKSTKLRELDEVVREVVGNFTGA